MLLNFEDLMNQEADGKSILLVVLSVIAVITLILFFIKIVRVCFIMERQTGKPAHTLIKVGIIAIAPTIFTVLSLFKIDIPISFSVFVGISAIMFIITVIWNINTYGVLGGLCFSLVHGVFGALACIGIGTLVFVGIGLILVLLFGGNSSTSSSNCNSIPSTIRDVSNGKTYYTKKGFNNEFYVYGDDRSETILRSGDYAGYYFDDNGNNYVST